jgi:ABC-type branched-subunit amino acid transport system ATPase component
VNAPIDARPEQQVLATRGLTVQFGGTRAVDALDLEVRAREVVGLIGPNGAGKTTTLNACAGTVNPAAGYVELLGVDVSSWSPAHRARHGIGRTFQRFALCDSLPVAENVGLAVEARQAGGRPWKCFLAPRGARTAQAARVRDALEVCGISDLAGRRVGSLSTGQRRLVELARAVCGRSPVLLLDEPSSGLDPAETDAFARIVRDIVADTGSSVLVVEHDMTLVREICAYLYVLDFGVHLCNGPTEAVLRDDRVRRAYLGTFEEPARA